MTRPGPPASVWFGPLPHCADHGDGPMRHDLATSTWRCAGWDGEDCRSTVTDEELVRHHLSTIPPADLEEFLP